MASSVENTTQNHIPKPARKSRFYEHLNDDDVEANNKNTTTTTGNKSSRSNNKNNNKNKNTTKTPESIKLQPLKTPLTTAESVNNLAKPASSSAESVTSDDEAMSSEKKNNNNKKKKSPLYKKGLKCYRGLVKRYSCFFGFKTQ